MKIKLSFILALVGISTLLHAQMTLSLSEAIQLGLSQNFDVVIVEDQEAIARNNNAIGAAGFLPSLNLTAIANNRFSDSDPPNFFFGETELVAANKARNTNVVPGVSLNWIMFNGFRAHITKSRLELLEEQSAGNTAIVIENTIQAIVLAYNQALVEKERTEIFREILDLSRERYQYVRYKKELGTATTFDLLQVKNTYFADSSNFILQQNTYNNSIRALNLLLTQDVETKLELTDDLRKVFNRYERQSLLDLMFVSNATLRNQYINQALVGKDLRLERSNLYPLVGFEGGSSYQSNFTKPENVDVIQRNTFDYYFNFSVSFNLFNGGNNLRNIRNAKIQEEIAGTSTEQMKLQLNNQLTSTLESYNTELKIYDLSRILVQDAKLNLDLADDKFRSGVITSFDYRDTQIAYRNAKIRELQNKLSLNRLDTELLRLTGGLIRDGQ